jgi:response regulator RpfG family c-di-GMP phosphodiesterase
MSNQSSAKLTTATLLSMGIVAYNAENIDSVEEILKNNKIDFLFIDFDFANNASFELLDKIKKDEKYSQLFIIGTSFNSNEKFIKLIQKYLLISFIVKPISSEPLRDKLQKIIYKLKNHFPERKHVRVEPMEDELMTISFQLRNKKFITAKVLNISLGGLAAQLFINYESEEFQHEHLIEHIMINTGNNEVEIDGKIVNKKECFLSVKFTHFYNNSYDNLSRYIMKKLSV